MKITTVFTLIAITLLSCNTSTNDERQNSDLLPIAGTWKLITATVIEKGDTVVTDYTTNRSFVKIINDTHFAFLQHDLNKGKDSTAIFASGAGRYSLTDSLYTEHLEYCSDRAWEGNDFVFTVALKNDTLTQSGVEKVEAAGVNRINIEKYIVVFNFL